MNDDVITLSAIVQALRTLGIRAGDLLLVCGSPSWLDRVEDDAHGLIEALLKAVGPDGTVAMHVGEEVTGWPRPLFQVEHSPSEQGPLSDAFRRRSNAHRSRHAAGSVAAIGPLAEALTGKHNGDERRDSPWSDAAFGYESPWQQLYERDAKYLLLANAYERATLFRLAQVMYMERMRGRYRPDVPCPAFAFQNMGARLEEEGLVRQTQLGQHRLKLVSARRLVDRSLAHMQQDPLALFPDGSPDSFGFCAWYRQIPHMERRLRAGFGKVCITPDPPNGHRGVYQDLWARAMVVAGETTRIGLIVLDLALVDRALVDAARHQVQEKYNLPGAHLMVACTHTHRVPRTFGISGPDTYVKQVVDAIVASIGQAIAHLQPVRVGIGRIKTEGLTTNRRVKLIDGSVATSRYIVPSTWYIPPEIAQGAGPSDPWLTTLRFEDLEGRVVGIVGNFTGHPLSAFRSHYISGDSFGHAEELMEQVHPGAVAMLSNGAQADTIVRGPFPERGPRYDPQAKLVGQMVGGYWLAATASALPVDGGSVGAAYREFEVPMRELFFERMQDSSLEVRERNAEVIQHGTMSAQMQVIRINDAVLVAMPGEVFVAVQLLIKEKSPFPYPLVIGCANDVLGYVPSREAFSEGGYEVNETGEWNRTTEDALGMLGMAALDLINDLWQEYTAE